MVINIFKYHFASASQPVHDRYFVSASPSFCISQSEFYNLSTHSTKQTLLKTQMYSRLFKAYPPNCIKSIK